MAAGLLPPIWNGLLKEAARVYQPLPTDAGGPIVFYGTGIQDNLADTVTKLSIPLWDFRPPA